jgi:hypothetical protein
MLLVETYKVDMELKDEELLSPQFAGHEEVRGCDCEATVVVCDRV